MKKLLLIKLIVIFCFFSLFFFLVVAILACMGYSISTETLAKTSIEVRKQSYLKDNDLYAVKYRSLLNKFLFEYGYVSMERVVWYLQATNNIEDIRNLPDTLWENAYKQNIDLAEKQMIPTKDMCKLISKNKYNDFQYGIGHSYQRNITVNLCDEKYIEENNLVFTTSYLNLPYISPIKSESLGSITSMVNEKRDVDLGLSDSQQANINFHSGWDLSAGAETNVYSICDGTILSVAFTQDDNVPYTEQPDPKNSAGNSIKIQCDGTKDIVSYLHLFPNSVTSKIIVGNAVKRGQLLAGVGTTGLSTGNHLHLGLETDTGIRLDAFYFINFSEKSLYSD